MTPRRIHLVAAIAMTAIAGAATAQSPVNVIVLSPLDPSASGAQSSSPVAAPAPRPVEARPVATTRRATRPAESQVIVAPVVTGVVPVLR